MDLFLTLRDGRTSPLVGVTSISSIDTAGTATAYPASQITSGSPYVQVSSTANIRPGSNVYGSGIPTGATVLSINTATTFTLSTVATATINPVTLTIATVTDADLKLLTVNSGWYRDIFTETSGLLYSSAPVGTIPAISQTVDAKSALTYSNPVTITPPSGGSGVNFSAIPSATTSDQLAHVALRQATWLESLWAFTCTTDAVVGPTLTLYYRKYEVIGFCNSAPSL